MTINVSPGDLLVVGSSDDTWFYGPTEASSYKMAPDDTVLVLAYPCSPEWWVEGNDAWRFGSEIAVGCLAYDGRNQQIGWLCINAMEARHV
jgi:hypothetical protein